MRKTEEVQLLLHEGMGQSSCWARAIYVVLNHVWRLTGSNVLHKGMKPLG